jgi:hypothetical protein
VSACSSARPSSPAGAEPLGFQRGANHVRPDRWWLAGRLLRAGRGCLARALPADRTLLAPGAHDSGSLDELLAGQPAFVVLAVPWEATPVLLSELAGRGASRSWPRRRRPPDIDGLRALAPLARLRRHGSRSPSSTSSSRSTRPAWRSRPSGRLGAISQVQVSVAHGYHGIDLIRRFLARRQRTGDDHRPALRLARRGRARPERSPSRASGSDPGSPGHRHVRLRRPPGRSSTSADEQYFSWIRGLRLLVRGERGEIDGMPGALAGRRPGCRFGSGSTATTPATTATSRASTSRGSRPAPSGSTATRSGRPA